MVTPVSMETPLGARMRINGREVDYFCGTSYFCLHGHPEVIEAACAATRQFGLGPGTLAQMQVYADLERRLCDWFGTEQVVTMISGYSSPMAMLQGLRDDFDLIFIDEATHYSARDAIPTLNKPVHRFRHLDADSLARQLLRHMAPQLRAAVVTDGVFPSTGGLAPLADYRKAMESYEDSILCVDDSHGVGVLGGSGRGSLQHARLEGEGNFFAGTLSKAFGALGGIVPANTSLADRIKSNAMILRGASLPPPGAAAAAITAMRLLETTPRMRTDLERNVKHMRGGLRSLGFEIEDTPVPIVLVRGDVDLERVHAELDKRDIVVKVTPASGYSDAPDVPTMRLAVFSQHTPQQIDRLLSSIAELL
ncbi:aminotransferase class I/II-fold pyridoxal phosphate-dependent enzyme [Pseudaminobacter soli (ex Li et al. 2025)]|uniref:8-amino-7-oxononanoate synthase n=1 Tax=Pseudaminobacter soli (ex Li et al. 2025) TaxID=1295366 RepID=A0A2P7S1S9_9HYPH|nr:pyridoxal phosphate-dependent aminotransferase family protein [Mesorhizobium soli]PSJ56428.1 8-amino-7-oxononanoate synthase [Mesorhizobium soli]